MDTLVIGTRGEDDSSESAIALGLAVSFAYALLVSRILSRAVLGPLASYSPNAIVVATLGVSLVLMELGRIAADTRDLWLPPLLETPVYLSDAEPKSRCSRSSWRG